MAKQIICKTPAQVVEAAHAGKTWSVRLAFVGTNEANKSGESFKFWHLAGNGKGTVTVRWGRIGTSGRNQKVSFSASLDRLGKKLGKGYSASTL